MAPLYAVPKNAIQDTLKDDVLPMAVARSFSVGVANQCFIYTISRGKV